MPWRRLLSLGFRGTDRSTIEDAAGTPLKVARQPRFRAFEVEVPGREDGGCGFGNLKLSSPLPFHRGVCCGCWATCFLSDCLLLYPNNISQLQRKPDGLRNGRKQRQSSSYWDFFLSLPNLRPKKDTILQRLATRLDQHRRCLLMNNHLLVSQSLWSPSPPWLPKGAMNR